MTKRIYEISLIGLGVVAVATLAFGVAHRAGKAREATEARGLSEGDLSGSAEGEALSSPIHDFSPAPILVESLPRDDALADIWGSELSEAERAEVLEFSEDLSAELDTRGETYDGLEPEDLGAEWLARATEAPPTPPTGQHHAIELVADESLAGVSDERDADAIEEDDLDRA